MSMICGALADLPAKSYSSAFPGHPNCPGGVDDQSRELFCSHGVTIGALMTFWRFNQGGDLDMANGLAHVAVRLASQDD